MNGEPNQTAMTGGHGVDRVRSREKDANPGELTIQDSKYPGGSRLTGAGMNAD